MSRPTEIELIDALAGMAVQYLQERDGKIHCDYVSASEVCISLLARLGLLTGGELNERILFDESRLSEYLNDRFKGAP